MARARRLLVHSVPKLRAHAVCCLEEGSGQIEQFTVGGVIQGLDSRDPCRNCGLAFLEVASEVALRIRRAGDQYSASIRQVLSNPFQEIRLYGRMSTVSRIGLVMNVLVRMATSDHGGVDVGGIELKYFCLLVVDPDDRMVVAVHELTR